jgi:gliding motility-associated-like protein
MECSPDILYFIAMTNQLQFIGALILLSIQCSAQYGPPSSICTTPGQMPYSAYPVCPYKVFTQLQVPICQDEGGNDHYLVNLPGCTVDQGAVNTFWLKFTCFSSGTLGFTLTPIDSNDDYNWELFDVTGRMPMSVFSDSIFNDSFRLIAIGANWAGHTSLTPPFDGTTGTSNSPPYGNDSLFDCSESDFPFSAMPSLLAGHNYLLMTMHAGYDVPTAIDPSGFSIFFGGGTAILADPAIPGLQDAYATGCGFTQVKVALSKPMKCNSLAADGSDFRISSTTSGSVPAITGAYADTCKTGFDLDTVTLTLSGTLAPGNYNLSVQPGTDGNTLLDACGNAISSGNSIPLSVTSLPSSTAIDSIGPIDCAPTVLPVVLVKGILCNSVDPNGSNFSITGPTAVSISSATCSGDTSATVQLRVSQPIRVKGDYRLQVGVGSSGRSLIDACGQPVATASSFSVTAINCYIAVPGAFTPNGDGNNDYLYPLDAYNATNLEFRVYDRWGRLVFQTTNWMTRWDGTTGGHPQPVGTYVWKLRYIEKDTGKEVLQSGTTLLIR